MPANADLTITFPSDFTLSAPTCVSVTVSSVAVSGFGCNYVSGHTITLTNVFASLADPYVYDVVLVIGNVLNPVPAVTTGEFSGTIGSDTAVPAGSAYIALSPGEFDSCSVTFNTAIVNQTSTMVITVDPKHTLSTSASIVVALPSSRRWTNDISTTNTLPLYSSMTCTSSSPGVSSVPFCSGNIVSFTLTASNLLTSSTSSSFWFGVSNFKSPPTLQPSDLITITSY